MCWVLPSPCCGPVNGLAHSFSGPPPGAVKKFKSGLDWEGEAPAEPHGARTCWGDGSPRGSPSQCVHSSPPPLPQRGEGRVDCLNLIYSVAPSRRRRWLNAAPDLLRSVLWRSVRDRVRLFCCQQG